MADKIGGVKLLLQSPTDEAIASGVNAPQDTDYSTLGGFQSNNFDAAVTIIEVTDKGSSENREILNERGIKTVTIGGEGFLEDTAIARALETNFFNQKLRWFRLVRDDGTKISGQFKLATYSFAGSHDGAVTMTISLESSGETVLDHP